MAQLSKTSDTQTVGRVRALSGHLQYILNVHRILYIFGKYI